MLRQSKGILSFYSTSMIENTGYRIQDTEEIQTNNLGIHFFYT